MKILIACEESGVVRDAFLRRGHDAISCDTKPTSSPGPHYQGDVRDLLSQWWDMIIAHPPCTYITNSGVRWLDTDTGRWKKLYDACQFFNLFLDHPCPRIVIENPIPHKYALGWLRRKYDQIIQPWQFGHTEQKATCLWIKGLPPLESTNNVKAEMMALPPNQRQRLGYLPPSANRAELRSKTFPGIAEAMADQWGEPSRYQLTTLTT